MAEIHPTAVIDPGAKIGDKVSIGSFCNVGANVVLGDGCRLLSHVVIDGNTNVGANTHIYPFASIGNIALLDPVI